MAVTEPPFSKSCVLVRREHLESKIEQSAQHSELLEKKMNELKEKLEREHLERSESTRLFMLF